VLDLRLSLACEAHNAALARQPACARAGAQCAAKQACSVAAAQCAATAPPSPRAALGIGHAAARTGASASRSGSASGAAAAAAAAATRSEARAPRGGAALCSRSGVRAFKAPWRLAAPSRRARRRDALHGGGHASCASGAVSAPAGAAGSSAAAGARIWRRLRGTRRLTAPASQGGHVCGEGVRRGAAAACGVCAWSAQQRLHVWRCDSRQRPQLTSASLLAPPRSLFSRHRCLPYARDCAARRGKPRA
jgi:hypothetical protein